MRRVTPTVLTLIVFWTIYAVVAAWMFYRGVSPVGRDVLLILAVYSVIAAAAAGVIVLRARLRHNRKSRAQSKNTPDGEIARER